MSRRRSAGLMPAYARASRAAAPGAGAGRLRTSRRGRHRSTVLLASFLRRSPLAAGPPASRAGTPGAVAGRLRTTVLVASCLLILFAAQSAMACPVCWGAPDDPMVKGVNKGIWVLLGLVGFVQIGFVALFWSFWRRAREQKRFRESLHVIEGGPLS